MTKIGNYTVREIQSFLQNNIDGYALKETKNGIRLLKKGTVIKDEDDIAYEWDDFKDAYLYISEYVMDNMEPEYLQKTIHGYINRAKIEALEIQIDELIKEKETLSLMISGLIKELNMAKKGE